MTTQTRKQRAQQQVKELAQALKTALEEARVQAHLGTMNFKDDAGPYFNEIAAATQSAGRDFLKRAKQLQAELKKIHSAHRKAS